MKLQSYLDKQNDVCTFNMDKFNNYWADKLKNYPKNSVTPRTVVWSSNELTKEKAEQFCSALDKNVSDYILQFSEDYFKSF